MHISGRVEIAIIVLNVCLALVASVDIDRRGGGELIRAQASEPVQVQDSAPLSCQ